MVEYSVGTRTSGCVCVEVSELQLWLEEQGAALASCDCGRSEEATEALRRKLDAVDAELENQRRTVEKLQESGASLQHLGHPNRYRSYCQRSLCFSFGLTLSSLPQSYGQSGSSCRSTTLREAGATFGFASSCSGRSASTLRV